MNALGMFAYLFGCFVIGGLLTIVIAAFRPVKKNSDFKAGAHILVLGILVALLPYGYAEILTKQHGDDMAKAVDSSIRSAKITGELKYYRILSINETSARVIVVAREKTTLNDNESAVYELLVFKDEEGKWKPKTYKFIDSFKRNKDSVSFPPFW